MSNKSMSALVGAVLSVGPILGAAANVNGAPIVHTAACGAAVGGLGPTGGTCVTGIQNLDVLGARFDVDIEVDSGTNLFTDPNNPSPVPTFWQDQAGAAAAVTAIVDALNNEGGIVGATGTAGSRWFIDVPWDTFGSGTNDPEPNLSVEFARSPDLTGSIWVNGGSGRCGFTGCTVEGWALFTRLRSPDTTLFAWDGAFNDSLFQIDTATTVASLIGSNSDPNQSIVIHEIEYGGRVIYGSGYAVNNNLHEIDPATGFVTNTTTLTFPPEGNTLTSMEFVGSTLYAGLTLNTAGAGGGGPTTLTTVDPGTGAVTVVGATGVPSPLGGLAFDVDSGVMYGISAGGSTPELFTIDLGSGAATSVGTVNIGGTNIGGTTALEFGDDGFLYALTNFQSSTGGHLFIVDPLTGSATDLGDTGQSEINALTSVTQSD